MGDTPAWSIRRATADDIEDLVRLRLAMMAEIAGHDGEEAEFEGAGALAEANRFYMREAMPAGEFVAYVAESGGEIKATSGLRIYRMAPHPGNLKGVSAYVLNMYTLPEWRGRGLASALLARVVEHARDSGATSVSLRATDAGRPVYERFGFVSEARFMSLRIAGEDSPE